MPILHLIAGPHGAGKTTLHDQLLVRRYPGMPFVDAQAWPATARQIAMAPEKRAEAARRWADSERQRLMDDRVSFATETAFSHPSRVSLLAQARSLGYEVVLYALAVDDPRTLLRRVAQRVREGGPAIASHKVLERYPKCLANLRRAIFFADLAFVIDAVDAADDGPRLVATVTHGSVQLNASERPRWVDKVLGFTEL